MPISNFPPKIQDWANKTEMREGIGALETWVKSGDKLIIPWPTEFVAEVQSRVIESMNLISAWKIIPLATITQIIDSITNNLLEFIIDIRKKYPNIKDENEYHNIKRKDVDSSFNNYISSSNFIEE
ncbi:MAG: hypothetical protein U5N56_07920 [Candidatus Marinimicrobia bacterium]|nr:hypothetical protein [Candidatus Neomarinimicrobiota bacterium]